MSQKDQKDIPVAIRLKNQNMFHQKNRRFLMSVNANLCYDPTKHLTEMSWVVWSVIHIQGVDNPQGVDHPKKDGKEGITFLLSSRKIITWSFSYILNDRFRAYNWIVCFVWSDLGQRGNRRHADTSVSIEFIQIFPQVSLNPANHTN